MKRDICYSVIGAGNGGIAMAGYLAKEGFSVNLYNRIEDGILSLAKDPVIKLTGEIEGCGKINKFTNNIGEAIKDTDIIMVDIPAIGHYSVAKQMTSYLVDGQIIVLNPGRTGGALEVYETIRENGCNKEIIVAEAQTFVYACRAIDANNAHIFSSKKKVLLSSIPSNKIEYVIQSLSSAYPQFKPAKDVMETSLSNYGAIFHPAPTLLNSGQIERGEVFDYYVDGITPSIAKILEKIDGERIQIANALNIETLSVKDWLYETYGAVGSTLYEAVQNNHAYKGIESPKGLNIRYIYEDVPYSLVPMSALAKQLDIETPAIDTIIKLAELMTGKDFWKEGRKVKLKANTTI